MDEQGLNDAAIMLMSLGEEEAAEVFKHFSPKEVQKLGETIARMRTVSREKVDEVINKFSDAAAAQSLLVSDTGNYVRAVLKRALGEDKAGLLIDRILQGGDVSGIESLKWMTPDSIVELIRNEHPQIIASILVHLERDLAAVPRNGDGKVAAYYQRRGFMTGTGTLIDDLMQRVGLVNLAGKLGKPPLSTLSLEEMVAAKPDFIIVESQSDTVTDQGTEMLHHPALRDIPRIRLPQAWTVCGGPAYVEAAHSLARQIAAVR